jgi:MFS family permease
MVAQAGLSACGLALLGALLGGFLTPTVLALVAAALGVVSSAHHPIRLALAPSLVPAGQIASAVTLGSVNFNLARLTGPALGGLLIAGLGAPWAAGLTAACFLPMIALLPGMELRPTRREAPEAGLFAALGEGVRYAARDPLIRRALFTIAVFSLVGRAVLELLPVLAGGVFGRGAAGLGALTAAAGAGALLSSAILVLRRAQAPGRLPRPARIAAPIGLLLVAALAWVPSWPLALATVAALGTCGTLVGIGLQTTIQLVLPDAYRGRVMSLWVLVGVGGAAVGALGLGALIDLAGPRGALTAAGLAGAGALLPTLLRPLAPRRVSTPSDVPSGARTDAAE